MKKFALSLVAASVLALSGCGDNGKDGLRGANGANGVDGAAGVDGTNGTNGTNGLNSIVAQTQLAVGNENCRNGGVQIDTGLDTNENGQLDGDEIQQTNYVCTPAVTELADSQLQTSLHNPWFIAAADRVEKAKDNWNEAVSLTSNSGSGGGYEPPVANSGSGGGYEPPVANSGSGGGYEPPQMQRVSVQELAQLRGKAKNVILFVGDGMGISTVTAARILEGQSLGLSGEEHNLSFDKFTFSGLSKTYNVDGQTPDSAGTMTAMMSGVKTDVGVIGVSEAVERGNCDTVAGNELVSALELAEITGMSTGVVTTARITHATPAATYAKAADRDWEDSGDMPAGSSCKDIADQLINFEANLEARFQGLDVDGIEVAFGGGRRSFLPKDAAYNSADAVSAVEGDRTDGRDLTAEWQAKYPTGNYVIDQAGFDAINPNNATKVFGLFNESHMQYEADRKNDIAGEPSLTQMTQKAIDILDNNSKGFFLMVESGRIDHGHHAGSAYGALTDAIEFNKAVQAAVSMTNADDTLIIVTADHSHVFTIAGYPKRGNPILGKVVGIGSTEPSLAADGMPYTTLGYTNGPGYRDFGDVTDADASYDGNMVTGRVDLTAVDTTKPGFHQEALVPLSSETHAGEDVGIYATGPGSHLVTGTNEQSIIFHIMDYAANLVNKADNALK